MSGQALYSACRGGDLDGTVKTIRAGAPLNWADKDGWTPLVIASWGGHKDVVSLLLEKGAAVDTANKDGWTPLMIATLRGHKDVVSLLLEKGAAVDTASKIVGDTPLLVASHEGHADVARLLLEKGAAVDLADKDGCTPLLVASHSGHTDVARLLLEKGAAIDRANNTGDTPLIIACFKGHLPVVRLLSERGANLHAADNDGVTALEWAKKRGHPAVAAYVKEQQEKARSSTSRSQQKEQGGRDQEQVKKDADLAEQVRAVQEELSVLKAHKEQEKKDADVAEQLRAMREELAELKMWKEAPPKAAPLDDCRIHPLCIKEGPELGRGGFGVVLHGQLQLPGMRSLLEVAIKKLSLKNPTEMERTEFTFEVIATVQASRRCPHVLHCYGYSALSDGSLCLVMKYYARGTLHDLIVRQVYDRLPMKQVLQLALDIALGVQELHAGRILIDDIKASNVLIDDDGSAVIADFGLSRPLVHQTHVSLTIVAGTVAYLAPEKHEDTGRVKVGFPADIWALGITLLQIVAADVAAPWRGQSPLFIMRKLALEKTPPEVDATPELPGLQTLIQDCLHIEPRSRPTADTVVKRLRELATQYSGR